MANLLKKETNAYSLFIKSIKKRINKLYCKFKLLRNYQNTVKSHKRKTMEPLNERMNAFVFFEKLVRF